MDTAREDLLEGEVGGAGNGDVHDTAHADNCNGKNGD